MENSVIYLPLTLFLFFSTTQKLNFFKELRGQKIIYKIQLLLLKYIIKSVCVHTHTQL